MSTTNFKRGYHQESCEATGCHSKKNLVTCLLPAWVNTPQKAVPAKKSSLSHPTVSKSHTLTGSDSTPQFLIKWFGRTKRPGFDQNFDANGRMKHIISYQPDVTSPPPTSLMETLQWFLRREGTSPGLIKGGWVVTRTWLWSCTKFLSWSLHKDTTLH